MRPLRKDIFDYDQFYHVFNKFNPELILKRKELGMIQKIIEKETLSSPEIKIVACNILQNHYHLLLSVDEKEYKERLPDDNRLGISVFMHKVNTKIARYVNRKKNRNGKVFYDRFKSKLVNSIEYFNNVFRYVTDNAMKHYKIVKEKWKYSSWHFYNKTVDLMQGFLVRFEGLCEKIYGVRPDTRNPLEIDYTLQFTIDDI